MLKYQVWTKRASQELSWLFKPVVVKLLTMATRSELPPPSSKRDSLWRRGLNRIPRISISIGKPKENIVIDLTRGEPAASGAISIDTSTAQPHNVITTDEEDIDQQVERLIRELKTLTPEKRQEVLQGDQAPTALKEHFILPGLRTSKDYDAIAQEKVDTVKNTQTFIDEVNEMTPPYYDAFFDAVRALHFAGRSEPKKKGIFGFFQSKTRVVKWNDGKKKQGERAHDFEADFQVDRSGIAIEKARIFFRQNNFNGYVILKFKNRRLLNLYVLNKNKNMLPRVQTNFADYSYFHVALGEMPPCMVVTECQEGTYYGTQEYKRVYRFNGAKDGFEYHEQRFLKDTIPAKEVEEFVASSLDMIPKELSQTRLGPAEVI